jgi:outer membrane immunogenic protein
MTFRTSISAARRAACCAAGLALAIAGSTHALAADLAGLFNPIGSNAWVRWDGVIGGAQLGLSNFNANFQDSFPTVVPFPGSQATGERQFGAFLGYNSRWDSLVLGVEGAYNKTSGFSTSQTVTANGIVSTGTISLNDYATARVRAGYPVGQFLPYGFVGVAVGRFSYAVTQNTFSDSRGETFAPALTAGLGGDVLVLPNTFLRAEWEYNVFAKVGAIRTNTNTGRVAVGLRF